MNWNVTEHGLSFSNKMSYMLNHYYYDDRVNSIGLKKKSDAHLNGNSQIGFLSKLLNTKIRKKTIFKLSVWPHIKNPEK